MQQLHKGAVVLHPLPRVDEVRWLERQERDGGKGGGAGWEGGVVVTGRGRGKVLSSCTSTATSRRGKPEQELSL